MKWEYYRLTTVEATLDESLAELGQLGWELVSVIPESRVFHGYQCLFKRPFSGKEVPRTNHIPAPHRINKFAPIR